VVSVIDCGIVQDDSEPHHYSGHHSGVEAEKRPADSRALAGEIEVAWPVDS